MNQIIPIKNIFANPENPRFDPVKNEQEAIDLMLQKVGAELLNLAKDVAQYGFNPSKKLMVVKEENYFIALEGNRRIIASKLLHDPTRANNKDLSDKFQNLKEAHNQIPNEIECFIFPDRASASRWVSLEHTGKNKGVGVLDWDNTQSQRFIAQFTGKAPSRSVQLLDFAKENKIEHDKIDATTLDRLTSTPVVREHLGIAFPGGRLSLEKSKAQVNNNLRKVFTAMSKEDFKVGKVYTKDKSKAWVAGVLGIVDKEKQKPKIVRAKNLPLDGDWVTHQLYISCAKKNRVKSILKELKDLNPGDKPNICATSLRVLLELAAYVFLRDAKIIEIIIANEKARIVKENEKKKNKKVLEKDWAPGFQRTLDYMANDESIIIDPLQRKALKLFISKNSNGQFLAVLNQFIHNPDYEPTPHEITEIWNKLGKLIFKIILSRQ